MENGGSRLAVARRKGAYEFDRDTMTIRSSYSGTPHTESRVVITECSARASELRPASSFDTMAPIGVKKGSVVREVQTKGGKAQLPKNYTKPHTAFETGWPT